MYVSLSNIYTYNYPICVIFFVFCREELGRKLQEATQMQEELVSAHVKDTEALKQSYEEEKHVRH